MTRLLTPSLIELSDNFLLSDLVGTHSVYTKGLINAPTEEEFYDSGAYEQGKALCENILEPVLARFGPISLTYGFITPATSRAIVGYQDPDKPSYHRWDLGAAADIIIHEAAAQDKIDDWSNAPITYALSLDHLGLPYSRMITYSESPCICLAVNKDEIASGKYRKAFYEYRYEGKHGEKPKNVHHSSAARKFEMLDNLPDSGMTWRGQGYPSYHGGGKRQFHHVRVSTYSVLSDYLYHDDNVMGGHRNIPTIVGKNGKATLWAFHIMGSLFDYLLTTYSKARRLSILEAYNNSVEATPFSRWGTNKLAAMVIARRSFQEKWQTAEALRLFLPAGVSVLDVEDGLLFTVNLNTLGHVYADIQNIEVGYEYD
ncbi:hypothetical protein [Alcaligenes faecalis]|uniref:hypothetical protein n=1 Tax=Alcaligenes faecalis TaxID=511 RepID=UPI0006916F57|nr:hypothetical protein [Alcaligenes faecalis]